MNTGPDRTVWQPADRILDDLNLIDFRDWLNKLHNLHLKTYKDIQEFSINSQSFWSDCWHYLKMISSESRPQMRPISSSLFPVQKFFPTLLLNYAENCLEVPGREAHAVIELQEDFRTIKSYSYQELRAQVHLLQDVLVGLGLQTGDNIGGALTNSFFAVALALAAASLGVAYSSIAPDMGISAIESRFRQSRPKAIFFHATTCYNKKIHDFRAKSRQIYDKLKSPDLKAFVIVQDDRHATDVTEIDGDTYINFATVVQGSMRTEKIKYVRVPFDAPLFIMFSSGTTGPPKCIVHSHGGVLLQHRKEHVLNMDIRPGSIYWQYTTTTWMMWQYQLSALASGAAIVVYDGSPMLDIPAMLRCIDCLQVTHFGTSPRWLAEITRLNINVSSIAELHHLRSVTSTGSVLSAVQFVDFYASWPKHVHLASVSGGTDLLACFLLGNMMSPVIAGELQGQGLGMSIKAWNSDGFEVNGEPGDLICDKPFPSQPIYFLADPDGNRYREAYYERFPGVWHHGDYLQMCPSGGAIILGRSDGVLNPSGVRFGSAEIYSVTAKISEIDDALCVARRRETDADEIVCLFLVCNTALDDDLREKIRKRIRLELSPRHVPAIVAQVTSIPVTGSGKKSETVVKQIISGQKVTAHVGVANPECLTEYEQFFLHDQDKKTPTKAKL